MKLNILSVLSDEVGRLRDKLESVEMTVIANGEQDGWEYELYSVLSVGSRPRGRYRRATGTTVPPVGRGNGHVVVRRYTE